MLLYIVIGSLILDFETVGLLTPFHKQSPLSSNLQNFETTLRPRARSHGAAAAAAWPCAPPPSGPRADEESAVGSRRGTNRPPHKKKKISVKEEFDGTLLRKYEELDKQILDLKNENRRIDTLDIFFLLYDIPAYRQIRDILGMAIVILASYVLFEIICKNGTKDKARLDNYCET